MRIVLTNVGKQEINNDIDHDIKINTYKRYKSENKVYKKYYPHLKNSIKKVHDNKTIDHSISHILTEENYLNDIIKNKYIFKKDNSLMNINKTIKINTNNNINNYKIIKLSNNNHIPNEIKELYIEKDKNKNEDIILDKKINNTIEYENKEKNKIDLNENNISLPLKDLLHFKNSKNINQNILFKQINKNEKNLINYLKSDRNIKPSFVEKINNANNEKLVRLDKICQIYFNNEKINKSIKQNIKERIKLEYSNDSKYCRENLINMGKNIQNCKSIFKSLSNQIEKNPS